MSNNKEEESNFDVIIVAFMIIVGIFLVTTISSSETDSELFSKVTCSIMAFSLGASTIGILAKKELKNKQKESNG